MPTFETTAILIDNDGNQIDMDLGDYLDLVLPVESFGPVFRDLIAELLCVLTEQLFEVEDLKRILPNQGNVEGMYTLVDVNPRVLHEEEDD